MKRSTSSDSGPMVPFRISSPIRESCCLNSIKLAHLCDTHGEPYSHDAAATNRRLSSLRKQERLFLGSLDQAPSRYPRVRLPAKAQFATWMPTLDPLQPSGDLLVGPSKATHRIDLQWWADTPCHTPVGQPSQPQREEAGPIRAQSPDPYRHFPQWPLPPPPVVHELNYGIGREGARA